MRSRSGARVALALVLLFLGVHVPAQAAGSAWGPPTQLAAAGALSDAAMAGDAAVLAWTDDGAVVAAYRLPDGTWDTDVLGDGSRPRVAVNADGLAVVVWQGSSVEISTRDASGAWSLPDALPSARVPTPSVNDDGVVRVLALGPSADVRLYTFDGTWSAGRTVNDRPLEDTAALRRSLTLTTDAAGRVVAGWLCPAWQLTPPGEPLVQGWICLRHPGSTNELIEKVPSGRYAVSAPGRHPIHLVTPSALCEIWPGMVSSEYWWTRYHPVAQVTLDVDRQGNGVAAWQLAGGDDELRVGIMRSRTWQTISTVAYHTHGLAGATLAEPQTALAFWRTADGELVTASKTGKRRWHRDPDRLGAAVTAAQLVSNDDGDALLVWSSAGSSPGIYVVERPQ